MTVVLVTLVCYKLALVGIGVLYSKRTRSELDFYLGGRKLGALVAAVSASASSSSAWTLLGVSGAAYAWGYSAVWLFPACVGGFLLNWHLVAPALQRLSIRQNSLTLTDVLAHSEGSDRGKALRVAASLIVVVSLGAYVSAQFQGAGKAFSETFQLPLTESIVLGAGVVVLYTLLGGFWAVSVSDTLQGLLMAASSVFLPLAALWAVGGLGELAAGLAAIPVEGYASPFGNMTAAAAVGFIAGLLGIGLGYPGQPHVVNRFMALEDREGSMRRARRIAIAWAVLVYSGMLLLGWCGRLLIPGLSDAEVVFISLTNALFHPVFSGIVLAAVLSAIMSTADSQLLVASSAITHDLHRAGGVPGLLRRSRVVVLLISAGAIFGALYGTQEIFSQVLFAWAAIGSAFGPLLLVTLTGRQVRSPARLASVIVGFSASVLSFFFFPASSSWKGVMERVFPFFLALAVAWFGATDRNAKAPASPRMQQM